MKHQILYHGSYHPHVFGDVLGNKTEEEQKRYRDTWSGSGFYEVLERYRPEHHIPHHQAVFACEAIEDIDNAGGATDYILSLVPHGPVTRHDMSITTEISLLYSNTDTTEAMLEELARRYWAGERLSLDSEPVWEYLMPRASVIQSQELDVAPEYRRLPPMISPMLFQSLGRMIALSETLHLPLQCLHTQDVILGYFLENDEGNCFTDNGNMMSHGDMVDKITQSLEQRHYHLVSFDGKNLMRFLRETYAGVPVCDDDEVPELSKHNIPKAVALLSAIDSGREWVKQHPDLTHSHSSPKP